MSRATRLCVVTTVQSTITTHYRGQFEYLAQHGYDICVVSSSGTDDEAIQSSGARFVAIEMERRPSPFRDLKSLFELWRFLRRERFDIVHVATPKAGLLGGLAARLAGYSNLYYTVHGRAYEGFRGIKRWLVKSMDWVACRVAKVVLPVGREVGQAIVEEKICDPRKLRFLANGTCNGINLERFDRSQLEVAPTSLRDEFHIPSEAIVILNLGWLRGDKGIDELIESVGPILDKWPQVHLLLIGRDWDSDPLKQETWEVISSHPRIHRKDWMDDPAVAYWSSDIVVIPSYREGFNTVALEAGASGLPVVGSDVIGLTEAIVDQETGLLVESKDVPGLTKALKRLVADPGFCRRLGDAGRHRVASAFKQEVVWQALLRCYQNPDDPAVAFEKRLSGSEAEENWLKPVASPPASPPARPNGGEF